MTFYYAITGDGETGIPFDDGNFYRAVKEQLSQGQTINNDEIIVEKTEVGNIYKAAYDEAMIMVIEDDTIINNIPSLVLKYEGSFSAKASPSIK